MTEAISEFLVKYGMEIATSYRTREDLSGRTLDLQPQLLLPTFYFLPPFKIHNSQFQAIKSPLRPLRSLRLPLFIPSPPT